MFRNIGLIPQIKSCLTNLGLKFCGFEAENIISQFKLTNSDNEDIYNLDKWHILKKLTLEHLWVCINFGVKKYNYSNYEIKYHNQV